MDQFSVIFPQNPLFFFVYKKCVRTSAFVSFDSLLKISDRHGPAEFGRFKKFSLSTADRHKLRLFLGWQTVTLLIVPNVPITFRVKLRLT